MQVTVLKIENKSNLGFLFFSTLLGCHVWFWYASLYDLGVRFILWFRYMKSLLGVRNLIFAAFRCRNPLSCNLKSFPIVVKEHFSNYITREIFDFSCSRHYSVVQYDSDMNHCMRSVYDSFCDFYIWIATWFPQPMCCRFPMQESIVL